MLLTQPSGILHNGTMKKSVSSNICSYLGHFQAQGRKNEKQSTSKKKILYFRKRNFFAPKKRLNFLTMLKEQSCKSYNNKYMSASTQIAGTEIFAFVTVLNINMGIKFDYK